MAELCKRQMIEQAEAELEAQKTDYLRKFGWEQTCCTPGSYWLWRRDFAKEDAAVLRRWQEGGPGPLGWPSKPQPYGIITAPTDLAVSMTTRFLDEEIDQDGDPNTPVITGEEEME